LPSKRKDDHLAISRHGERRQARGDGRPVEEKRGRFGGGRKKNRSRKEKEVLLPPAADGRDERLPRGETRKDLTRGEVEDMKQGEGEKKGGEEKERTRNLRIKASDK